MFCPSNDKLQSLTEKTKLLAQKCTQQIRVQTNQCSPLKKDNPINNDSTDVTTVSSTISTTTTVTSTTTVSSTKIPGLKYFCPCKGSLRIGKRSPTKDCNISTIGGRGTSTTRWYVKVIQ